MTIIKKILLIILIIVSTFIMSIETFADSIRKTQGFQMNSSL